MIKWVQHLNDYIARHAFSRVDDIRTKRTRLKIVRSLSLFLFALVIIRMADLALLQPTQERHIDLAKNQGYFERADIVDRNGVLLATTLQVPSLFADPSLIDNKPYIAQQLSEILNIQNPLEKLNRTGRFVWIKRGITPDQHYQVNALGSPGLAFRMETRRLYPQGAMASHLVGYSSVDGRGLAGIELEYNDRLFNQPDALRLSMDIRIQYALAKSLHQQMQNFEAKAAMGGVIDIETGEVIAAVSLPDFDPHHAGKAPDAHKFNRFATGVYEMGSTFKLFSTAAYIEETGKGFSTTFDAREPLQEGRFTINDFHAEKRILTLPEVFIYSSNIGSALMGRAIGDELMQHFYRDLGLLSPIETDFPALGKPLYPDPWRPVNTLTAAYGHGVAVSALHVLQATAAIVNGGVKPDLSFTMDHKADGTMIQNRVISAPTAHKMRQLLRLNAMDGSGKKADVPGYIVGGKTGTSEKIVRGEYRKDRLMSSFIGVFPAHAPRYAVLAVIDEPKGQRESHGYATGGWTAAPAVGQVIADIARIYGMAPDLNPPNLTAGLQHYLTQDNPRLSPASYAQ